jgi:hypothetical protein
VVYNGVPYVFTESNCYALDFGGTDALPAFKPRITSIGIGVLNHSSVISLGPQGVILINQSGIYITDCEQQIERISDYGIQNFFTGGVPAGADGDDNNNVLEVYDPTQLQESAAFYKGKLFVSIPIKSTTYSAPTWTVTQTRRSFVYSPIKQNWSYLYIDISVGSISAFLTDASGANEYLWCLTNSTNLANDAGSQYWGALGVFVPANIFGSTSVQPVIKIRNNTGAEANLGVIYGIQLMPLSMGIPNTYKEFSSVLIDLEVHPYGAGSAPVCTIGGVAKTLSIGRQTSLHTLATEFAQLKDLSVGLSNQRVTLYNLTILYREDEEALTLWEIPPTANALQGWHMYKGAYITLRSSAITQLIVQADEQAADTYEIASTGGTKKKIYVGFLPKKGKVWNFKFQTKSPAVTPFRLYGEDSEFLVKSWGSRGWQVANPLTASGYAGFLRKGGGT